MKVMAFIGSPRQAGNTSKIIGSIGAGLAESGHQVEIYRLADLDNKGCRACGACQANQVEYCAIHDKTTELLPKIANADCIIVGTPVYMLQMSGYMKNFLDRLFAFFIQSTYTTKYLPGKKYMTVTCSGAPAAAFRNVTETLNQLFGDYFKMENAGNIVAGDLLDKDDIMKQPEILKQARDMGRRLSSK